MATVQAHVSVVGGQLIGGGQTRTFVFNTPVDDAYWNISAVPTGSNNNIEILRKFINTDASGVRSLSYVVRNNTNNPTTFTRGAIRAPE